MRRKHFNGFTLMELVVVMAIAAIMVTIGAPAVLSLVKSNKVTAMSNEIVGTVNLARSEAVKRQRSVTICRYDSGTNDCATSGNDWTVGWLIYADEDQDGAYDDPGERVRLHEPLTAISYALVDNSNNPVWKFFYDATGFINLAGASKLIFKVEAPNCEEGQSRHVTISPPGRPVVSSVACGA